MLSPRRRPSLLTPSEAVRLNGCDTREEGGAAFRQDALNRKCGGLMTETTQEFVQLFYRDGSIIQPLQDK